MVSPWQRRLRLAAVMPGAIALVQLGIRFEIANFGREGFEIAAADRREHANGLAARELHRLEAALICQFMVKV